MKYLINIVALVLLVGVILWVVKFKDSDTYYVWQKKGEKVGEYAGGFLEARKESIRVDMGSGRQRPITFVEQEGALSMWMPDIFGSFTKDSWDNFYKGAHGRLVEDGDQNAPTCSSCHTSHNILSASDTSSAVHPFNLHQTCGQCHSGDGVATGGNISIDRPIAHFLKGVHGKALAEGNGRVDALVARSGRQPRRRR